MMISFLNQRWTKQQQPAAKFLHLHQESQSLSIWTTTRRWFSGQSTINNSATPLTFPTVTYTMLSTLVATRKQSSSTKGKITKKSKLTARHLIIGYPISTGTTPESGAATKQHLLRNQNSRRLTLLTRKFIQNAFYTPKESTQISNASSFTKHSEHPHFLPTKTTKKRANTSKILPDNQWRRSQVCQLFNKVIFWAYPRS